jgi:pyroglutamyl-peptidase
MIRVLLTAFGPFPGAPKNPTGTLIERLARLRRPALHDAKITKHVFKTSYAAVDRDLPKLIVRHKPDVLLMFGLATRASDIRIETRARNALAAYRDAAKAAPRSRSIVKNTAAQRLPFRVSTMLGVLRNARVPARISRDAGAYLCNYLCWQAATAAGRKGGPRLAAFIHVPKLAMPFERPFHRIGMVAATGIASAVLGALVAEARRP